MTELSPEDSAPLQFLLKATSKSTVVNVCRESFNNRHRKVPDMFLASVTKALDIQPSDTLKLFQSVDALIEIVLYEGLSDSASIAALFPEDFHKNLKGLLSETIANSLPEWKDNVLNDQVSIPRLVGFDWRVDVKTSSDSASRMAQPTCIVQMKVQDIPHHRDKMAAVKSLNVEFSHEALETMLDGLGKIRKQLSSVTSKS